MILASSWSKKEGPVAGRLRGCGGGDSQYHRLPAAHRGSAELVWLVLPCFRCAILGPGNYSASEQCSSVTTEIPQTKNRTLTDGGR